MEPRYLTLAEAAKLLNVQLATLRAQVYRRKLRALKLGRDWLVEQAEVARYHAESQGRGQADPETTGQ